jgi:phage shock protein C
MDMGVVIIVVVAIIGGIGYDALKMRYKYQQLASGKGVDKLEQDINELKQRIATLESIVTDKPYQLKQQINQL